MDTGNSIQITGPGIALLLLAAGLISSLITVVATKILEIWHKKIDYAHSLGRALFEQKLVVAKAAISRARILQSSLQTFILLLDQIIKNIGIILGSPPEHLLTMLETSKQDLSRLRDPAFEAANALSLFFDIDESPSSLAVAKKIMDLFALIDTSATLLAFLNGQYLSTNDTRIRGEIIEKATKLVAEFQGHSRELNELMEKGLFEISQVTNSIRTEMKQYEPRRARLFSQRAKKAIR